MEEEPNYVTVTFRANGISANEKPNDLEIIYDEVVAVERARDTTPAIPENKKDPPLCSLLHQLAAGLGVLCVVLVTVIVTITIQSQIALSEQDSLEAQNVQLHTERADLERLTEELTREKDRLNWTIGVILEYENFPVKALCPQKVCQPCRDGWKLFQSNCYQFLEDIYSSGWKNWERSREECKKNTADLVMIDSQEEQEFINNHTKYYRDEKHGYWIGLKKTDLSQWMWVDRSNVTVTYWRTGGAVFKGYCALTLSKLDPLANWVKVGCGMNNRWICETKALIKESI